MARLNRVQPEQGGANLAAATMAAPLTEKPGDQIGRYGTACGWDATTGVPMTSPFRPNGPVVGCAFGTDE